MSTFPDQIWRSAPNIQNSNFSAYFFAVRYFFEVGASASLGAATTTNLNKENLEKVDFLNAHLRQLRGSALNFFHMFSPNFNSLF